LSAIDIQHGGNHYKNLPIQPIEFIMANQLGFAEGNVIKYLLRDKDGLNDLLKARHYIQFIEEDCFYRRTLSRVRMVCQIGAWWNLSVDVDTFIKANCIINPRAGVIRHIAFWNCRGQQSDLDAAAKWLDELIASYQPPAKIDADHRPV
jgi:hypothetical protein